MRLWILLFVSSTSLASAQTVLDVSDARRSCFTGDVVGLSAQLSEFHRNCLRPGEFVRIDEHPNITLNTPDRTHPYMQAVGRDALHAAAEVSPHMQISSVFRTVADQYVLWASVGFAGGCTAAAQPGSSRHQSGRAVDFSNWEELRSDLEAAGCVWLGTTVPEDPFHFDCPGENRGEDAVLAFQTLWNVNNTGDTIAEDGIYGPMTQARLEMSPAVGFAMSGCGGCTSACEGNVAVAEDCTRTTCIGGETCVVISAVAMCTTPTDAGMGGDAGVGISDGGGFDASAEVERLSDGCGCRVVSRDDTAGWFAMLALGVWRMRRKLPI